jgi:hypothetical protein
MMMAVKTSNLKHKYNFNTTSSSSSSSSSFPPSFKVIIPYAFPVGTYIYQRTSAEIAV